MLPVLPPGTLVIAHKYIKSYKPGQVVVVLHEGKEKIKRISEVKDSQIHLVGDHPNSKNHSHSIGWINTSDVIARVVWPRRLND